MNARLGIAVPSFAKERTQRATQPTTVAVHQIIAAARLVGPKRATAWALQLEARALTPMPAHWVSRALTVFVEAPQVERVVAPALVELAPLETRPAPSPICAVARIRIVAASICLEPSMCVWQLQPLETAIRVSATATAAPGATAAQARVGKTYSCVNCPVKPVRHRTIVAAAIPAMALALEALEVEVARS
jgi:hypothetical protein